MCRDCPARRIFVSECLSQDSGETKWSGDRQEQLLPAVRRYIYLECQTRPDLLLQNFGDGSVEVGKDLHRQLRVDAVILNQVIQGVCESDADTVWCVASAES